MVANMNKYDENWTDEQEKAQKEIDKMKAEFYGLESRMVALALDHNIDLYLDGHGYLLLEDRDYKTRGEWYTSTDSCS